MRLRGVAVLASPLPARPSSEGRKGSGEAPEIPYRAGKRARRGEEIKIRRERT